MRSGSLRRSLILSLLLAPGLGYLAVFFAVPLATTLVASFQSTEGDAFTFKWYALIFERHTYFRGLLTSMYYGIAPLPPTLLLSIALALLMRRSFVGRRLFNGLYKIPLAVPSIIVALMVLVMVERGGFVDRLIAPLGFALPKLVRDEWGLGVIIATCWKQVPFMTLIIGGAFAAIAEDISLAARSVGASRWQTLVYVEIPLALPGITAAILLNFILSVGSYAIPALVGPPNPVPLSVLMVSEYIQGNFNQVFAMGMVLSLFAILVLVAYYILTAGICSKQSQGAR